MEEYSNLLLFLQMPPNIPFVKPSTCSCIFGDVGLTSNNPEHYVPLMTKLKDPGKTCKGQRQI
jgi:hypothetical protein